MSVKHLIPLFVRIYIVKRLNTIQQFGFFFKLKLIFKLMSAKKMEDLQKWRLMTPRYGFLLRGISVTEDIPFLRDKRFRNAYEDAIQDEIRQVFGHPNDFIMWRAHLLTYFLDQCRPNEGDFVECGVWYGWLSKTIINYLDFESLPNKFYLIDGWNMDKENEGSSDLLNAGTHSSSHYFDPISKGDLFSYVKNKFNLPNVHLVRGYVPEVFDQNTFPQINKVAYLGIDMNGSEPELAALNYFYPKLVKGGLVYLDDYGHGYSDLVKKVDQFLSDKPETLLYSICGSAIFIKQ